MSFKPNELEPEDRPITARQVLTWGTAAAGVVLAIIAGVWKFAELGSGQAVQSRDLATNATRIEQVESNSVSRDARQEAEINDLKRKSDAQDAKMNDAINKLTKIETIVTRIDEKTGRQ